MPFKWCIENVIGAHLLFTLGQVYLDNVQTRNLKGTHRTDAKDSSFILTIHPYALLLPLYLCVSSPAMSIVLYRRRLSLSRLSSCSFSSHTLCEQRREREKSIIRSAQRTTLPSHISVHNVFLSPLPEIMTSSAYAALILLTIGIFFWSEWKSLVFRFHIYALEIFNCYCSDEIVMKQNFDWLFQLMNIKS